MEILAFAGCRYRCFVIVPKRARIVLSGANGYGRLHSCLHRARFYGSSGVATLPWVREPSGEPGNPQD